MKKKTTCVIATLMALFSWSSIKAETEESFYGATTYCDTVRGIVNEIEFYSPSIVNVRKYMPGTTIPKQNLAVTMQPQKVNVSQSAGNGYITLATDEMQVRFYTSAGLIRFYDADGNIILNEKALSTTLTKTKDGAFDSYKVSQKFSLTASEQIYGFGQLQNGSLNQRSMKHDYMVQGNMSVWIPYFYSTKGYSIFWDNASPTTYSESGNELLMESAVGYGVDYFFMYGKGEKSVANMRQLTGQVPMIPLWAYGYFQSKERYTSADETMAVMKKYRDLAVPIDCVVQDWQYWGDNNMWNALQFNSPSFTNHQQMIDSIHAMNGHLLISTWANFGPDTKPYQYFKQNGMLIKQGDQVMTDTYPGGSGVAVYDPYNAKARDYYWKCLYEGIVSKGTDAYWLDSSEPDHYQGGSDREKTFDFVTGLGCTWRAVRNAFPLVHVEGIYNHHRAQTELASKRVCILTRSSYAGLQRTGANTWSGDITASWDCLARQIPAALNFSICGNPNWNADIGAFFIGDYQGVGNPQFQELYARWFQFATFTTMLRSHGAGIDKAIYKFGETGTPWYDLIDNYINLRYHLLPYIYSTAWDIHLSGLSMMNAMPILYPDDAKCYNLNSQFMFGRNLLVAPVLKEGAKSRNLYLPMGEWVDFWTGEQQAGGINVKKDVDINTTPIYVKSGTILPYAYNAQHTNELLKTDSMQIRIYPGNDGEFLLYEDEGDNYNYEKGEYSTILFTWNENAQTLTIGKRTGNFKGMLPKRTFDLVLVTANRGTGTELSSTINKRVQYDGTAQTISLATDDALRITISDKEAIVQEDNSKPYQFRNTDWETGDPNRVAQSNIAYHRTANTINMRAGTGQNNTALSLKKSFWDYYKVKANRTYFCVTGTNLSTNPDDHAVWFMCGGHFGTVHATKVLERENGNKIVIWDLTSRLPTYASYIIEGGPAFSICFGCTSTANNSVISDINFYTKDEVEYIGTGIDTPNPITPSPTASYSVSGILQKSGKKGLSIVTMSDGSSKKILSK